MDLSYSPEELAFRNEVRDWLAANFPDSLKGKDNSMSAVEGPTQETPEQAAWRKAMGEKGWGTPTWPKSYGGGGLSPAQARVLQQGPLYPGQPFVYQLSLWLPANMEAPNLGEPITPAFTIRRLGEDRHRLVDLLPGHDERRRQAQHGLVLEIGHGSTWHVVQNDGQRWHGLGNGFEVLVKAFLGRLVVIGHHLQLAIGTHLFGAPGQFDGL